MADTKQENVTSEDADANNSSIMMYQFDPIPKIPKIGKVVYRRPKPENKYQEELSWKWNPFAYLFAIGTAGMVGSYATGIYYGVRQDLGKLERAVLNKTAYTQLAAFSLVFAIYYYNKQKGALENIEKNIKYKY